MRTIIALAVLLLISAAEAQLTSEGWKYLGGADAGKVKLEGFYSSADITHLPDGHIRVWTKQLRESALNSATNAMSENDIKKAAALVAAHYSPPLAALVKMNSNQVLQILSWEIIADEANIEPYGRVPNHDLRVLIARADVCNLRRGASRGPLSWSRTQEGQR